MIERPKFQTSFAPGLSGRGLQERRGVVSGSRTSSATSSSERLKIGCKQSTIRFLFEDSELAILRRVLSSRFCQQGSKPRKTTLGGRGEAIPVIMALSWEKVPPLGDSPRGCQKRLPASSFRKSAWRPSTPSTSSQCTSGMRPRPSLSSRRPRGCQTKSLKKSQICRPNLRMFGNLLVACLHKRRPRFPTMVQGFYGSLPVSLPLTLKKGQH